MIFGIGPLHLIGGLLIFIRILGMFTSAPVFGHAHVPAQLKVAIAFVITLVLAPIVALPPTGLTDAWLLLAAAAVKEVAVGVTLGFAATLVFTAIQLAGEAADIQIGFGLANIADPLLSTQTSLIGQFQYIAATLFFLTVNGHHLLLAALARSFEIVPLGGGVIQPLVANQLLATLGELFAIGLKIGGPVMLAVFLTDLALGLLGRTMPQMNLLMVGFPVKILAGLGILLVSVPFFLLSCRGLFDGMYRDLVTIMHAL